MESPWVLVDQSDETVHRRLLERPVHSDPLVWSAIVLAGASLASVYNDHGQHTGAYRFGQAFGFVAIVGGAAVLRRRYRNRLTEVTRTTLKTVAGVLVALVAFGAVAGLVSGRGTAGPEALTEYQVQVMAGHIRNGTQADQATLREFAGRRITPDQAQRLAVANADSPLGQDVAGLDVAERNEYFLGLLDQNLPGMFTDEEFTLAAGWRVCLDVPGNPESRLDFIPAAGSNVTASDAVVFAMMAVRVLCPQHLADAFLLAK